MIKAVFDLLICFLFFRVKVIVLCQKAYLHNRTESYFVNVTNRSLKREVEITHVWLQIDKEELPILNYCRPLPKRLKPQESWETWIEVNKIPKAYKDNAFDFFRIMLSTGKIIRSNRRKYVPAAGNVPG